MPSSARRDIFSRGKSDIVRFFHSDIIFAPALAKRISLSEKLNITAQQYHSPQSEYN